MSTDYTHIDAKQVTKYSTEGSAPSETYVPEIHWLDTTTFTHIVREGDARQWWPTEKVMEVVMIDDLVNSYSHMKTPISAQAITLSDVTKSLIVGGTFTISWIVTPNYAEPKTIVWTSSDSTKATVDSDGKVTAIASWEIAITWTCWAATSSCVVTITDAPAPEGDSD